MNRPDLIPLLGKTVEVVGTINGGSWTGTLVGLHEHPTMIIDQADGLRRILPQHFTVTERITADRTKGTGTPKRTLVIAHSSSAARTLAAELIAEHGLDPAETYPLAVGAAPRSRPYAAAVLALPPRGLSWADVAWVEDAVLVRLKRGAELVVRPNPRKDTPAHRPPPTDAGEPALVERIAEAIEALCPHPDVDHAGGHCPYREAAATARKIGAAS
ncbi:hypothetical protein [Streptosporangium sp. NPDC049078]|uniref:hypothetical protein n=1 Tax=Streptosporangium sp. NPDC049078 TaxID=3155767 RepID=UPI003413874E